jgi:hypothetical protein
MTEAVRHFGSSEDISAWILSMVNDESLYLWRQQKLDNEPTIVARGPNDVALWARVNYLVEPESPAPYVKAKDRIDFQQKIQRTARLWGSGINGVNGITNSKLRQQALTVIEYGGVVLFFGINPEPAGMV